VNDWYFGPLDRAQTEKILMSCDIDAFLVRNSSRDNCFAVSRYTLASKTFIHYIVEETTLGYYLHDCPLDTTIYMTLADLVTRTPLLKGYISAGLFK